MILATKLILDVFLRNAVIIFLLILVDNFTQFIFRFLLGRRSLMLETVCVFFFFLIGSPAVALVQSGHFAPGMALYIAGFLVYLSAKGMFSRGYSIRILVDLLEKDHPQKVSQLKENYGGKGLRWMLDKRIQTLKSFWIIRCDKGMVGPPTVLGRIFALLGDGTRRLLKLNQVG